MCGFVLRPAQETPLTGELSLPQGLRHVVQETDPVGNLNLHSPQPSQHLRVNPRRYCYKESHMRLQCVHFSVQPRDTSAPHLENEVLLLHLFRHHGLAEAGGGRRRFSRAH